MKVLPARRSHADAPPLGQQQSGQTLGRGMDFALVVLVFLGIGYVLDRWLGTRPLFMIGLVVFAVVGQFIKIYYDYTATMQELEAKRAEGSQAQRS